MRRNYDPPDEELCLKIQDSKDNDSLKLLIERHTPICINIYKKYINNLNFNSAADNEILTEKDFVIYKSAISYRKNKGSKFSTWLANQIRYHCLHVLNRNRKEQHVLMEDKELNTHVESTKVSDNNKSETDYVFSVLGSLKDKRIKKIFKMRYFDQYGSWQQISNTLNISKQTCLNLHEKGRKLLKAKLVAKEAIDLI